MGLAGMDFDHEGLTLTPWGDRPVSIKGLKLHGVAVDVEITGAGSHVGSFSLDGVSLPAGSRKIQWSQLKGKTARIELVRSKNAPACPVIVRADGLRVDGIECGKGTLRARIEGTISGEVIVQSPASSKISVDGTDSPASQEPSAGTFTIPVAHGKSFDLVVSFH